jgi:hypothetical protein
MLLRDTEVVTETKIAVLWDEAPCSLPEKLIAEDYSPEEGGSVFLRTVAIYIQTHTAV